MNYEADRVYGTQARTTPLAGSRLASQQQFLEFIRQFREENTFVYQDQLRKNYHLGRHYLEVNIDDLDRFEPQLADHLRNEPLDYLPLVR